MPKTKTKSSDLVQTSLPREARVKHHIHFPMYENVKKLYNKLTNNHFASIIDIFNL